MKKRHLNPEFDVILVEDVNSVFASTSVPPIDPGDDNDDLASHSATSGEFFNTSAPSLYEVTTDEKK